MLEKIKTIPNRAMNVLSGSSNLDTKPVLTKLRRYLRRETSKGLAILAKLSGDLYPVRELHLAIDNLTNIEAALRRECRSVDRIGAEFALIVLGEQFAQTAKLLNTGAISNSIDAGEIAIRTLNLLFQTKQRIKQEFGIVTPLDLNPALSDIQTPTQLEKAAVSALPAFSDLPEIVVPVAMLFQLSQSLFPAERMIVGAARKYDRCIRIEGLFDVTGQASSSGVKADPGRIGEALIAMSQTSTYFGLWVHSHPGTGPGATHPSGIDISQHADWLKNYSADLVSAIMVKDQYIRFWGTAIENGKLAVRIEGSGAACISSKENIYRLGS